MIRTVLSTRPTARNRERCSPGGTLARLIQTTSADISFRSVYSFSWPDYNNGDELEFILVHSDFHHATLVVNAAKYVHNQTKLESDLCSRVRGAILIQETT